jgi:hypothetical protein
MSDTPHVYVIGGGLAGMTVAYALARERVPVTILESSGRLGGKAGADYDDELGIYLDHGFHIFPLWYANVRGLMQELGIADRLIDTDTQHTIERPRAPDQPGRWFTNYALTSVARAIHNLRNSPLRVHHSLIGLYFLLDLATEPFARRGFLDRVSVNGYFRSRFYRNEQVANFHHFLGLQASSIPADTMSALTFQQVLKGFMQYRHKLVGMLRGDLQTQFIEPFRHRLEEMGVEIILGQSVRALSLRGERVAGLAGGAATAATLGSEKDVYVLATPPERTRQFVDDAVYALDRVDPGDDGPKALSGLQYLTSEPMAALHVVFRRRLPHIPPWHTGLQHSRYGLSLIDISQHWPELAGRDQTVLSVIAADFKPLLTLGDAERQRQILDDLLLYLRHDANGRRVIDDADVVALRINPNTETPLFLNTTSAWHYRPDGRTRIANLFVAGDYCRSQADLTSMESAVSSGFQTAVHILKHLGKDSASATPRAFDHPSRRKLQVVKYPFLWLVIAPIGVAYTIRRRLRSGAERERH